MILYRPTDGDVHDSPVEWRPRTCFVMAQLGTPMPAELVKARKAFSRLLRTLKYKEIDADKFTTGRDFLLKIWSLAVAVPVGIAFVHEGMSSKTIANVFYELGWMQAYGKETLVIRVGNAEIPSDFVRTEYVTYDKTFERRVRRFFKDLERRSKYYLNLADQVERNPLLSIDFLRRAYLLTGDKELRSEAKRVFEEAGLAERAKNSVEQHLLSFCQPRRRRRSGA